MTLILGLENGGEAILAADSRLSRAGDSRGMYTQGFRKLVLVNGGDWLIGVANSSIGYDLIELIEEGKEAFNHNIHKGVHEYAARTNELYKQHGCSAKPSFLLAGTGERDAAIYGWDLAPEPFWGATRVVGQEAIGAAQHGALYFSFAFHGAALTTRQRITLAYLCVNEASKLDPRCGPPVQIGIVRPAEKARIFTSEDLVEVQSRSEEIAATIGELISSSNPMITGI